MNFDEYMDHEGTELLNEHRKMKAELKSKVSENAM